MPKQLYPSSDGERSAFLRRCAAKAAEDAAAGIHYLTAERVTGINTLADAFNAARDEVTRQQTAQTTAIDGLQAAMKQLRQFLHITWSGAELQVSYGNLPASALEQYRVMALKDGPRVSDYHGWFDLTRAVIAGAAALVRDGHTPVATPSAAELQGALEAAEAALQAKMTAETALDTARVALGAKRDQIHPLLLDTLAELRMALRHRTPAARRQVLRAYGVRYSYAADETPDPEDVVPATGDDTPPLAA